MNFKKSVHIIYDVLLIIGMAVVYLMEALIPRRYRAKSIAGEIALVTGGANGIGRLIAIKLAKLGAQVIIWDIDKYGEDFSSFLFVVASESNGRESFSGFKNRFCAS